MHFPRQRAHGPRFGFPQYRLTKNFSGPFAAHLFQPRGAHPDFPCKPPRGDFLFQGTRCGNRQGFQRSADNYNLVAQHGMARDSLHSLFKETRDRPSWVVPRRLGCLSLVRVAARVHQRMGAFLRATLVESSYAFQVHFTCGRERRNAARQ